jgi:hypothetical protein
VSCIVWPFLAERRKPSDIAMIADRQIVFLDNRSILERIAATRDNRIEQTPH